MQTQTIRRAAQSLPSAGLGNQTTATLFQTSGSVIIVIQFPDASQLERKRFKVSASGRVTTGATSNFTVAMYLGTAKTTSDTKIATSTARSVATTSAPWIIEVEVIIDSTAKKLHGWQRAMVNNLVDAAAALSNVVSSLDPTANLTSSQNYFSVSGLFGTGNASNTAFLDDFALMEQ